MKRRTFIQSLAALFAAPVVSEAADKISGIQVDHAVIDELPMGHIASVNTALTQDEIIDYARESLNRYLNDKPIEPINHKLIREHPDYVLRIYEQKARAEGKTKALVGQLRGSQGNGKA